MGKKGDSTNKTQDCWVIAISGEMFWEVSGVIKGFAFGVERLPLKVAQNHPAILFEGPFGQEEVELDLVGSTMSLLWGV